MKNQEKIYVIGHKNPDTDSISSSIAYTDIKNRTDPSARYLSRRAGQINEETQFVLNYFHMDPPPYLGNIGTQVKDMDFHRVPRADATMSLKTVWELMQDNQIVTLPIVDEEEGMEGIVTISDIARTFMDTKDCYLLSRAKTKYHRIVETLNGIILEGDENAYFEDGKVFVGTADPDIMRDYVEEHDMVILGNREQAQYLAIEQNVSCIISAMGIEVSDEVRALAREKGIVVIMCPYDAFTIAHLINQSIPVGFIMKKDNIISFSTEDYTDDIQEIMVKTRHNAFPVINKKGKVVGTISRRNFLDMKHKKVILVDHNEKDQAVDNIESAEILEIMDHHKLGSLQTIKPINFRNEPVGCTATILYRVYEEHRLDIPPRIAGLLCAAILSDTLMFRSPTCTQLDKIAASALAFIANIRIEDFARQMFRAGSNLSNKTSEEIFYQDYKKFIAEGNLVFGVGQISSMEQEELDSIRERLNSYIEEEVGRNSVQIIYFMLTNILEESTKLIYFGEGSEELARKAFDIEPEDGAFLLKGVVSRKKQVIPALMQASQATNTDY